jgi:hypothetical protein
VRRHPAEGDRHPQPRRSWLKDRLLRGDRRKPKKARGTTEKTAYRFLRNDGTGRDDLLEGKHTKGRASAFFRGTGQGEAMGTFDDVTWSVPTNEGRVRMRSRTRSPLSNLRMSLIRAANGTQETFRRCNINDGTARCRILDAGVVLVLAFDVGCWMLDVGCWCWMLELEAAALPRSQPFRQNQKIRSQTTRNEQRPAVA